MDSGGDTYQGLVGQLVQEGGDILRDLIGTGAIPSREGVAETADGRRGRDPFPDLAADVVESDVAARRDVEDDEVIVNAGCRQGRIADDDRVQANRPVLLFHLLDPFYALCQPVDSEGRNVASVSYQGGEVRPDRSMRRAINQP